MTKIIINGVLQDMSAEEEQKLQEVREQVIANREKQNAEENTKKANQASGNQKLLDLGLTQAEATALTGYTPLVADEE